MVRFLFLHVYLFNFSSSECQISLICEHFNVFNENFDTLSEITLGINCFDINSVMNHQCHNNSELLQFSNVNSFDLLDFIGVYSE